MTVVILTILSFLLLGLTLLPMWRHEAWWVRAWDFPRFQLSVVALLIIVLDLMLLDYRTTGPWLLIVAAMGCLAYQLWWIIPYTPFFPIEVESSNQPAEHRRIRIMTANVLTPNRNSDALINLVHNNQPDVLVALESDAWWQSKLDAIETDFPYTMKCPLDNLYGMHVYSKLPLSEKQIKYLVQDDVPSMHALLKLPFGEQIRIHFLHPAPPSPTENEESAERDAELVIVAKSVSDTRMPVIVTGDLNDVAWSTTTRLFRKLSGLLDPRVGRGMFNTFHAKYGFIRWPLDHLFHSSHFKLCDIRRLPPFGSDHFALFTELCLESSDDHQSSGLEPEKEDQILADEKIKGQNVAVSDVPQPEKHRQTSRDE